MALKRVLWIAVPIGVAAGLAIALLPPRPLPERESAITWALGYEIWSGYFHRDSLAARDVQAAVRNLKEKVALARRADSLDALAQRGRSLVRSADGRITVLYEPPLTADSARRVLDAAEREVALYPAAQGQGMPVIVALYADSTRHRDLYPQSWRRRQFLHQGADGTVCLAEINRRGRRGWGSEFPAWPLDRCAVYARFGERRGSGARPLSLLGEGAHPYYWDSPVAEQLVRARRQQPRRPAPWEWRPAWSPPISLDESPPYRVPPVMWEGSACLAGGDASCLAASGMGRRRLSGYMWWWFGNPVGATSLVVALLATGDGQRFEKFWRSDLPDAQALEAVYGMPAGQVVRAMLQRRWVPAPHGPQITAGIISAAAGWIVVALGLAVVAGRRRQARS
jgi:hypothetical protein